MARSTAARKSAFEKKGTGQFKSISKQTGGPQSTKGVTQTSAPSVNSRFVTLPNGKTGTVVDNVQADINPNIQHSSAFADKYNKALAEQSTLSTSQQFSETAQQGFNPLKPDVHMGNVPTGLQATNTPFTGLPGQQTQQLPASAPGIQSKNVLIQGIGNYLDWGSKLGQKEDGSYETSIFTPGTIIKGVGAKTILGGVKQSQVIKKWVERFVADAAWKLKNRPMAVLGTAAFMAWFTQEVGATYPFTKKIDNDAVTTLNFAFDDAKKHYEMTGDASLMNEAIELNANVTNPMLRTFADKFPFTNVAEASGRAGKALEFQNRVNIAIMNDTITQKETGMTDDEMWDRRIAKRNADELELAQRKSDIIDISARKRREADEESARKLNAEFNASRIKGETAVQEIKASYGREERRADRKAMEESAAFWLEYQKQKLALLEEEREEQERFWLAYKKKVLELEGSGSSGGGRSSLGFGLLR